MRSNGKQTFGIEEGQRPFSWPSSPGIRRAPPATEQPFLSLDAPPY